MSDGVNMSEDEVSKQEMEDSDDRELEGEEKVRVMVEALKAHQIMVRATASETLSDLGQEDPELVLPLLVKHIADEEYWTVRFGIVDAIQSMAENNFQIPEKYVVDLQKYLKDEDREFRGKVAAALGHIGNPIVVPTLLETLNDEEEETREIVAEALGRIGDEKAADPLLERIRDDDSHYVRRASAWALGEILKDQGYDKVEPLIEALQSPTESVFRAAATALGKIQCAKAVLPLLKILSPTKESSPEAREEVLLGLRAFSEQTILDELKAAAGDDDNILLDLIEEAIFHYPFKLLIDESKKRKETLIGRNKRSFKRVKTEIDSINAFVADTFKGLAKVSEVEHLKTMLDSIPRKRRNLSRVDLEKISEYAWVRNELHDELRDAQEWYQLGQGALDELEAAIQARMQKVQQDAGT